MPRAPLPEVELRGGVSDLSEGRSGGRSGEEAAARNLMRTGGAADGFAWRRRLRGRHARGGPASPAALPDRGERRHRQRQGEGERPGGVCAAPRPGRVSVGEGTGAGLRAGRAGRCPAPATCGPESARPVSVPQSTVCEKIMELLGQNEVDHRQRKVVILSQDRFYTVLTAEQKAKALKGQYNFDHPGRSGPGRAEGGRAAGSGPRSAERGPYNCPGTRGGVGAGPWTLVGARQRERLWTPTPAL